MPCLNLKRGRANRKGNQSLLDDKDLLIGMFMQPNPIPWRHVHPNKRKVGISMLVSLELIGIPVALEFVSIQNGIVHICLLLFMTVHSVARESLQVSTGLTKDLF